ncbi:MAG: hypothetical protein AAGE18_16925 [Pseudomonadota bacterium]
MTFTVQSTDIITTGDAITLGASGDDLFLTQGTTIVSEEGHGIVGAEGLHSVQIAGTVIRGEGGRYDAAISLTGDIDGIPGAQEVTVFETGIVSSNGTGIEMRLGLSNYDAQYFSNYGLVEGRDMGVNIVSASADFSRSYFLNTGTITSQNGADSFRGDLPNDTPAFASVYYEGPGIM